MSKSMLRYCVKCPDSGLRLDCMENEPMEAVRAFIDSTDVHDLDDDMAKWNRFRQDGYRLVRVRIEELESRMVGLASKDSQLTDCRAKLATQEGE